MWLIRKMREMIREEYWVDRELRNSGKKLGKNQSEDLSTHFYSHSWFLYLLKINFLSSKRAHSNQPGTQQKAQIAEGLGQKSRSIHVQINPYNTSVFCNRTWSCVLDITRSISEIILLPKTTMFLVHTVFGLWTGTVHLSKVF